MKYDMHITHVILYSKIEKQKYFLHSLSYTHYRVRT